MDREFMDKYILPNVQPGDLLYDEPFFLNLLSRLHAANPDLFQNIGASLIAALCCALKRGDLVPQLFQSLITERNGIPGEDITNLYVRFREAITVIWTFIGGPLIVPAGLGLSYILKQHGVEANSHLRGDCQAEVQAVGSRIRKDVYKSSSNAEAQQMLVSYFGDFAYGFETFGFGYNVGKAPSDVFSIREMELLITSGLVGMGPTRQARNHVLACFGMDFTVMEMQALVDVASELAIWARRPFDKSFYNIPEIAEKARENLQKIAK